ncbi:MAG: hypothetical protein ACR2PJ_07250 [Pseudomonadales bacterium]
MNRLALFCCAVSCFGLCPGFAHAETSVSGYIKSFAIAQEDNLGLPERYLSQNTGRFMLDAFKGKAVFQLHYEVSPVFMNRPLTVDPATFNPAGGSYRLTDIKQPLSGDKPDDKRSVYQNLDRFNVQLQLEGGDLTLGRQAITFGSARVINPTDVFLPFDVRTFNTEYRNGVDALRFQKPVGELGEVDVGLVLGDDAGRETSAAFLQLRGNVNGKDLHFALIEYAEQTLVGAGLESALGSFGFWLEAAAVDGDESYVRLSTGLDYAFSEDTFGLIEYHYNGAGSRDPADYLGLLRGLAHQRGGVFLLGENYLVPGLTWQASPLWSLSAQAIVNLDDSSAFASVAAEYNVAENFYMDFGYYWFIGDEPIAAANGLPSLASEYGADPNTLYASIRWYF